MKVTYTDIMDHKPCYDPIKYIPKNWAGTLLDVLNANHVPAPDRIWLVTRFLDDKTNRLFAVWCAREALKLVKNPDQRSIEACNVAERFAHGNATVHELNAAAAAARAAAAAARAAAWAAARAAAWAAARAAAWAAARAADAAADAAARAKAELSQIEKLKQMIAGTWS